jgi:hypothetical protein
MISLLQQDAAAPAPGARALPALLDATDALARALHAIARVDQTVRDAVAQYAIAARAAELPIDRVVETVVRLVRTRANDDGALGRDAEDALCLEAGHLAIDVYCDEDRRCSALRDIPSASAASPARRSA